MCKSLCQKKNGHYLQHISRRRNGGKLQEKVFKHTLKYLNTEEIMVYSVASLAYVSKAHDSPVTTNANPSAAILGACNSGST